MFKGDHGGPMHRQRASWLGSRWNMPDSIKDIVLSDSQK